ncbi:MAG: hypothetical protein IJD81_07395 [Oscillospiraceae bacterium]|nr:hypothetical protein [Oscillospiraceae bacterium]
MGEQLHSHQNKKPTRLGRLRPFRTAGSSVAEASFVSLLLVKYLALLDVK